MFSRLRLFFPSPFSGDLVWSGDLLPRTQDWGLLSGALRVWRAGEIPASGRGSVCSLNCVYGKAMPEASGSRDFCPAGGGGTRAGSVLRGGPRCPRGPDSERGADRAFPTDYLLFVPMRKAGPARPGDSLRTAWAVAELEFPNFRSCALCSPWSRELAPSAPSVSQTGATVNARASLLTLAVNPGAEGYGRRWGCPLTSAPLPR